MGNLNKVYLMGNLTRDPEVRYTSKGTSVGDLGLAVNESFKDAKGEWSNKVIYINVTVWGRQAETAKEYLAKGRPVFIEGKLQLDTWEKDGKKRYDLKVIAERIQFLGTNGGRKGQKSSEDGPGEPEMPSMPEDEDCPI